MSRRHCCDINLRLLPLFQLREQMLTKMTTVLADSPTNTTQEVQVTARAVAGLTQISDELTPAAQVQYSRITEPAETI